jgi:ABC-type polysaccharide/polyol phosphate export permease
MPLFLRTLSNLAKSLNWAWLDTVCQYRRSKVGPLWETINVLVMVLGLSLVSSTVFGTNMSAQIGRIGIGVITWTAISSFVSDGSATFIRNAPFITSSNISIDLYVGRTVFRTMIIFAHHLILYALGVALGLVHLGWANLLAVPGLVLLFLNGFWIVGSLAFLCARFRDLELIVRNLLQLAFFVTPVFWNHEQIASSRRFIIDYNIFFYLIEIVRAPLLGQIPPLRYYIVILCVTIVGYLFAYNVYRRMRSQLAFFV